MTRRNLRCARVEGSLEEGREDRIRSGGEAEVEDKGFKVE